MNGALCLPAEKGPSARAIGARPVGGGLYGFLDSDATILPTSWRASGLPARASTGGHVLCGWRAYEPDAVTPVSRSDRFRPPPAGALLLTAQTTDPAQCPALRRQCFVHLHGFDESLPPREQDSCSSLSCGYRFAMVHGSAVHITSTPAVTGRDLDRVERACP